MRVNRMQISSFVILTLLQWAVLAVEGTEASSGKDYDKHGCCLSCGEFFCPSSEKCVTEWGNCDLGTFNAKECTYTYTATLDNSEFHYDLQPFDKAADEYFVIHDQESHSGQEFSYYFRLCDKVDDSLLPDVCHKTTGTGKETCHGKAMAFQYYKTDWDYESCYRISDCFPELQPVEISLIDPVKPATGVKVKYSGGNSCPQSYAMHDTCDTHEGDDDTTSYCLRSFTLNVYCHNEINEIISPENIIEAAGCAYMADINHVMGCPVECPRDSDGRICSARGLCYYSAYDGGDTVDEALSEDDDNTAPLQCVCEKGYYGDACEYTEMSFGLSYYSKSSGVPKWIFATFLLISLMLSLVFVAAYFERIKVLASGIFYLVNTTWDEYWSGGRSTADGKGSYSRVSVNSDDKSRAISSELASKSSGEKYFGVLKPNGTN